MHGVFSTPRTDRSDIWAPRIVWGVWAVLVLAALSFVRRYGSDVPFFDEWDIVPFLTGEKVTAAWLWAQHNEHRIPIPKLVLLALYGLSGDDFRAGMVFNVLALGALAFVLIRAAAKLRAESATPMLSSPLPSCTGATPRTSCGAGRSALSCRR
jgi:hypothetical protein